MTDMQPVTVEIGDFVRSTLIGVIVGFVVDIKAGHIARTPITLVVVEMANGKREEVASEYIDVIVSAREWATVEAIAPYSRQNCATFAPNDDKQRQDVSELEKVGNDGDQTTKYRENGRRGRTGGGVLT